ncbi:MAG: TerB family tellurite resistance protein [Myxococcales bacterium]|nr:TerB family tellurite resistance protein [Myxococcales bacterium]
MRFVCSFAWADLEVQDAEKTFARRLFDQLDLDDQERAQVERWLKLPPPIDDVDPTDIPGEHRQIFLNTMLQVVGADNRVDSKEMETLSLFEQLLQPDPHED